ncbi:MAG: hypothetical protein L5656_02660 [Thermanaeromonas sp.]|uniref:hypothetical protein n=1 Tax=Thermanaeromonas sp. TaxID=2003697 RepID=UPI00243A595B|nr:hypothetical protein [Thermanaeromonas sp.]MCG0277420.1 hypothetical protein [Thermanaeromonas sp.]
MPGELVHPSFLNLIRSLKPYVGYTMLQYIELAEDLLELLSTEKAQKVQSGFLSLREERKSAQVNEGAADEGTENEGLQSQNMWTDSKFYVREPYILFLILILLILSFH